MRWARAMSVGALAGVMLAAVVCGIARADGGEPGPGAAKAKTGAALPATRAGRMAGTYLEVFNAGNAAGAEAWESANRTDARLKDSSAKERAGRMMEMRERFGTLTVTSAVDCGENSVFLEVVGSKQASVGLNFVLDSSTGKFDYVEVSSGGPIVRPEVIDRAHIARTVEAVAKALEEKYVYPEVAAKMGAAVRQSLSAGEYDSIRTDGALASRLMADLRAVSKDKHLGMRVAPPEMRSMAPPSDKHEDEEPSAEMLREMARENYGFRKVEVLPENIGYVRFDHFAGVKQAIPTFDAAMGFVANCDAIIFDMRQNGGGSPEAIRQITSYLFDQKTHLNDMIDRNGKVVEEFWTLESVNGKRIPAGVPVYVLTASRTFSGAEEFTYNLKNLKRATVIGETTGGGAHPVRGELVAAHYMLRIPYMRANNPISKTNWEGTGVEPDIKVPASEALERALVEARKAIEKTRADGK